MAGRCGSPSRRPDRGWTHRRRRARARPGRARRRPGRDWTAGSRLSGPQAGPAAAARRPDHGRSGRRPRASTRGSPRSGGVTPTGSATTRRWPTRCAGTTRSGTRQPLDLDRMNAAAAGLPGRARLRRVLPPPAGRDDHPRAAPARLGTDRARRGRRHRDRRRLLPQHGPGADRRAAVGRRRHAGRRVVRARCWRPACATRPCGSRRRTRCAWRRSAIPTRPDGWPRGSDAADQDPIKPGTGAGRGSSVCTGKAARSRPMACGDLAAAGRQGEPLIIRVARATLAVLRSSSVMNGHDLCALGRPSWACASW